MFNLKKKISQELLYAYTFKNPIWHKYLPRWCTKLTQCTWLIMIQALSTPLQDTSHQSLFWPVTAIALQRRWLFQPPKQMLTLPSSKLVLYLAQWSYPWFLLQSPHLHLHPKLNLHQLHPLYLCSARLYSWMKHFHTSNVSWYLLAEKHFTKIYITHWFMKQHPNSWQCVILPMKEKSTAQNLCTPYILSGILLALELMEWQLIALDCIIH